MVAGDEGSSTAGGNDGEDEGTSGPAGPQKARTSPNQSSPSAKKAGGKLRHPNSKNGKKGRAVCGGHQRSGPSLPLQLSDHVILCPSR